mmetsp:Transcript_11186/g.25655  ORF Transcript_11186/g.25655 Transcript_11186/m.25655 type:complete len:340 (+) Transcript_11186:180-1199(+)
MLPSIHRDRLPPSGLRVEVEVPRGLKFSGSPHLAVGKLKALEVPTKSYEMVVLPSARRLKPKEQFKRPLGVPPPQQSEREADGSSDEAQDARSRRVPQSLGSRMFPALVSPRHMGPSRGESSLVEHKSSPSRSPSPPKERKEGPASKSVEFERKASKDPPMMTPWLSGKFDGTEPVFNRLPSLHEGAYDAEHGQRLEEYHKSKRRWIAGPIRPSGAHDAKRALDTSRLEIDNHIMDARTRGKVGNELLKQRYDTRRAAFKKEHDKEKSSFESRYDESPGSPAPSSPGFSPRLSRAATTRLFGNQVNPALAIENSRPVADPAILGLFKSAFKAGGTDMAW